jgi:transposase
MIQLAWRSLEFQRESALSLWYHVRTTDSRIGTRKTMIVALARKLIAFWRFDRPPGGASPWLWRMAVTVKRPKGSLRG